MNHYYYDRAGRPITLDRYSTLFGDQGYQVLRQETLPNGLLVSTVWLGVDHQHAGGPPIIFETMVFPPGSRDELACRRYSTEADALEGHSHMAALWEEDVDAESLP